jgi:hypothetical protein
MVCQNCQHIYAISSGIPNMVCVTYAPFFLHCLNILISAQLLNENEIQ